MKSERPTQHDHAATERAGSGVTGQPASHRLVAGICVTGLLLTAIATFVAWQIDRNSEERLLQVQTRQAASVLSSAVLLVQQPLGTALTLQSAVGSADDVSAFTRFMSSSVGPDSTFASAALWQRRDDTNELLASIGEAPTISPDEVAMQRFLDRALSTSNPVVLPVIVDGRTERIAWAQADPVTGFVVYAERAIPADRRARVDRDPSFADLDYAVYVGDETDREHLATTNMDPDSLPLDGVTYETTIPYGDRVLTLVTSPYRHLGAPVSQWLPLILLASGILLTALAVVVTSQLVRGRREAERHTTTITALYERVDSLYEEQRALFVRLQRALLPQTNPLIPRLEIASEYVAGTQGIDIGGDWYSVIGISDDEFAFVVGDVSGRGVDAVAVMAHARFTIRAYLVEGHSPSVALEKCSHQFDISADGHITTALVGVGNWRTGRVTIANAGHPLPLMLADSGTTYIGMPVGPPLGVGPATYDSMTFDLSLGTSLLLYTDGLIERRTEDIDIGMDRLAETAHPLAHEPLALLLTEILAALRDDDASDDIAMLALRRVAT